MPRERRWTGNADLGGGAAGTGNLNAEPHFAAPSAATDAPTTAGNYRLQPDSAVIDKGNNAAVTATTDLDGKPRIVDGSNAGTAVVDMGAYEWQSSTLYLPAVVKQ